MSQPMTADQWLAALRAEGITDIVQMNGWRTHNRAGHGAWGEVHGVAIHHTAGVGSGLAQYCYNGTPALPGPVCHDFLAKDGTLYLVGNGRTNHAGTIPDNVYASILREDMNPPRPDAAEPLDGNRLLYGLEIENRGDGRDPYPAKQYDVAVRWAAARCRFHGWTAGSARGHKELTRRKIDPSFPMDTFRRDVTARLGGEDTDMTPEQATQLKELHDLLTPYAGWGFKSTGKGADHTRDAMDYLMTSDKNASTAVSLLKALKPGAPTDAQMIVLAATLAKSPVLAERIAELVAQKLAARLEA
jgi:hypothetical protein